MNLILKEHDGTFRFQDLAAEVPRRKEPAPLNIDAQLRLAFRASEMRHARQKRDADEHSRLRNDLKTALLPTPRAIFENNADRGGTRILADIDIEPGTISYLEAKGFHVVRLDRTNARQAPKKEIYAGCREIGALFATHAKYYCDWYNFDVAAAPGIMMLPKNVGSGSPEKSIPLALALHHVTEKMPRDLSAWLGRIFRYTEPGELFEFSKPERPHSSRDQVAVVMRERYMPLTPKQIYSW